MFFPHPRGAWGSGDIPRRHQEKIAFRVRLKHPQSDLCGVEGSIIEVRVIEGRVILDMRH